MIPEKSDKFTGEKQKKIKYSNLFIREQLGFVPALVSTKLIHGILGLWIWMVTHMQTNTNCCDEF